MLASERYQPEVRLKLASLQVLRGIAACVVVAHHVALATTNYGHRSSWIGRSGLGSLGAAGVDLFFVISGFIMLYSAGESQGLEEAGKFLVRRGRRVLPLYWIWTTILLVLWKAGIIFKHVQYAPLYVLCSYLLWPIANGATFHPVLDQGWTLTFELLFYLLFSLTIAFGPASRRAVYVVGSLLMCMVAGRLCPEGSSLHYLFGNTLLIEFGMGVIAAMIVRDPSVRNLPAKVIRRVAALFFLSGAVALLCTARFGEPEQWRFLVWGVPSFLILLGVLLSRVSTQHRLLLYLGDASYSIYLAQTMLVAFYASVLKHGLMSGRIPADLIIVVSSVCTIALTTLAYKALEKPLLALLHNRERKLVISSPLTQEIVLYREALASTK